MLDVVLENRVEDLIRDDVDMAVRVMSEPPQGLVARDMGSVHYVVCASRAYAEASGIKTPRIWTAERDMEMWKSLQS